MALSSCSISIRIILPAFRLARFLRMLFHLITPSLFLLPAAVNIFVLISAVQTVSTEQLNFCQRVVNRHTIIDSHSASSSSELLEMLLVPTVCPYRCCKSSFLIVCSTTGSPKVSLGSGIVTRPVAAGSRVSTV